MPKYYYLCIMKFTHYIVLCITLLSLMGCQNNSNKYITTEGGIWATTYHITYQGSPSLADSILPTLNSYAKSVSVFDKNSIVSLVNSKKETNVDDDFIEIFNTCKKIYAQTHGAFDPTVEPLIEAWGFGKNRTPIVDTTNIKEVLKYIGLQKVSLNGKVITKDDPRISFNFSAIAKGAACDKIAQLFQRHNVKNYLIEIGGEIVMAGRSPRGADWNISIDTPDASALPGEKPAKVISLSNCGVATSGNYRNNHTDKLGKTYGHTINPRTGHPATTDVLSATVIAKNAMYADAYATAAMVLGSKEAITLADSLNIAMFLILSDNTSVYSSTMKKYIK